MLSTYKAILKGNRLAWSDEAPDLDTEEHPVAVHVTLLEETAPLRKPIPQGQRMAAALEQLAALHALADLPDPAAWERETRQDRSLPDREV